MRPRILYRTHYQVDEPRLVSLIVQHCTSAVESSYSERVSERLWRHVVGKGRRFNVAAAGYAVDLARGLGVLSENNTWTDKGHLVALTGRREGEDVQADFALSDQERFLYFRLFLDADGAVLRLLARAALTAGSIPSPRGDWNGLAQATFHAAWEEYLQSTSETTERVRLRGRLERLMRRPFRGRTGEHKLMAHLQAMCRVGLLRRASGSVGRVYTSKGCTSRLEALCRELPDVATLEQRMARDEWPVVADAVLRGGGALRPELAEADMVRLLLGSYGRVVGTGVPLCSVSTLVDGLCIVLLAGGFRVVSQGIVLAAFLLGRLQKEYPKDVRFHVDRRGRPVFVKIASWLVAGAGG